MAKKNNDVEEVDVVLETNPQKLSKALIKELNKDSAEKVAWCLATDRDNPTDVKEFIPTGSTLLDYIISNRRGGGIPVGKLTEISGEEASGKSLLCAHILSNCQKMGGIGIYIDEESSANPDFMRRVGVDIDKLVYVQMGTIERVFETIEKVIIHTRAKNPKAPVCIVWDSIAGTPPQAEIEGSYDPNDRIGLMAKALAKGMRKLTQTWAKERIAMVFTNQLKTKIGVMYGDPMATPGGKAVPYHASVRVRLTRSTEEKDESTKTTYAINTYAKVVKDRLGPPLRRCSFQIFFSHGIDDVGSWFDYLHSVGEIEKRAGWCYVKSFGGGEGLKLREKEWNHMVETSPELRAHVLDLLEKHMVIKYDAKEIPDMSIDPESLMDVEAVAEMTIESAGA